MKATLAVVATVALFGAIGAGALAFYSGAGQRAGTASAELAASFERSEREYYGALCRAGALRETDPRCLPRWAR